ncbi:MAG: GAF domain-containing protein [Pyrinomonadaceae bacterium]
MSENQSMTESNATDLPAKLQRLIETIDIANILTEPLTRSIAKLLEISAAEINSEEASVLIRDGDEGDLRFLSAIGQVAEQLINLKVPAGKGIAGFVLSSGQPMAVSDVGEESSFYSEVDKTTGYSTQMILATPLSHNGEVIGVLEYINRRGEPPFEPFTPVEMDRAAFFAEAVASLVNAYESAKLFRDMGEKVLAGQNTDDIGELRSWLSGVRDSAEHRGMMDLAILMRELASRGEAERVICRELLESIVRFSDSKTETSYLSL